MSTASLLDDVGVVVPTMGREILRGCLDSIVSGTACLKSSSSSTRAAAGPAARWLEEISAPA